jgi:hypothetical protein
MTTFDKDFEASMVAGYGEGWRKSLPQMQIDSLFMAFCSGFCSAATICVPFVSKSEAGCKVVEEIDAAMNTFGERAMAMATAATNVSDAEILRYKQVWQEELEGQVDPFVVSCKDFSSEQLWQAYLKTVVKLPMVVHVPEDLSRTQEIKISFPANFGRALGILMQRLLAGETRLPIVSFNSHLSLMGHPLAPGFLLVCAFGGAHVRPWPMYGVKRVISKNLIQAESDVRAAVAITKEYIEGQYEKLKTLDKRKDISIEQLKLAVTEFLDAAANEIQHVVNNYGKD